MKVECLITAARDRNRGLTLSRPGFRRQLAAVTVGMALFLPVMVAIASLAIDFGYFYVVRCELQNAADAAALAGAQQLVRNVNDLVAPNWNSAITAANNTIPLNMADNKNLVGGQVSAGYWNTTGAPGGLIAYTGGSPGANYYPAIQVTIAKTAGTNNGPVMSFFGATLLGLTSQDLTATAVAVAGGIGYLKRNLMPIALADCLYGNPPTTAFASGSPYAPGGTGCYTGQWTSLTTDNNSANFSRTLIDNATGAAPNAVPPVISIGANLWIQPGVKDVEYQNVNACSELNGDGTCGHAVMAVVGGDISTHTAQPVTGFACVNILGVSGNGANAVINMQLILPQNPDGSANPAYPRYCQVANTGGVGPPYGLNISPKLVNYAGNDY